MRGIWVFAALVAAGAMTGPAEAQDVDCNNAVAQADLNACAESDFEAADKDLNATYRAAMKSMRETDADLEDDMKGAEAALKKAQRAWIDYRDANCEAYGFQARGGSMEPMLVSGCKAELTRQRTKDLKELSVGEDQ